MLEQRPCPHMDIIVPSLKDKVEQQQLRQKSQHDKIIRQWTFQQDDLVMVSGRTDRLLVTKNSCWYQW